ncbi:MAG: hypothetical protein Q7T57_07170 [Dehalococcoidales bacterium]|nr:hypothetical protein [Dehalococcoidales bacterium]
MFSWEIVRQRNDRTLIATLVAPPLLVSIDWAYAFTMLEKPALWDFERVTGLPWGEGRTQAAYDCLNRGYQWLFFLDSDNIAPQGGLMRLLSHRLPIVSALYHQKFPTWTGLEVKYLPCMFHEGRDDKGNPRTVEVTDFQYGQLVEVAYAPAGCLLIHRSVFERMLASGIKRFFEWTLTAENPQGRSEDFDLCTKARSIGFKVMVDTGIQCIHEAQAKVDIKGLSSKI